MAEVTCQNQVGWDHMFFQEVAAYFSLPYIHHDAATAWLPGEHWSLDRPEVTTDTNARTCAIGIKGQKDTMVQELKLGALPQLFDLLTGVGGMISVLGTFLGLIFVKKHKQHAISKLYDERTMRFIRKDPETLMQEGIPTAGLPSDSPTTFGRTPCAPRESE